MLRWLKQSLIGVFCLCVYFINITFWGIGVLLPLAILKLFMPTTKARDALLPAVYWLVANWFSINDWCDRVTKDVRWEIQGQEHLNPNHHYLIIANHQSWVDVMVFGRVFNRRIPLPKFFIKRQIMWYPIVGLACWALDFPFMRRYTADYLKKHPEKKGKDIETTRKACESFRRNPTSIFNFVEGTRFTPKKHARQNSPYQHLLKPKAGGVGFVMTTMGDVLTHVLNVTIIYPSGKKQFWDYLCGRVPRIIVRIDSTPISDALKGDYINDKGYRVYFQQWLNQLWSEKDTMIEANRE